MARLVLLNFFVLHFDHEPDHFEVLVDFIQEDNVFILVSLVELGHFSDDVYETIVTYVLSKERFLMFKGQTELSVVRYFL